MQKDYERLSTDQFQSLVSHLPEIRGQMKELPALMRNRAAKLVEMLGEKHYSWGYIYELPLLEQLALLLVLVGLNKPLHEAVNSPSLRDRVMRWADDGSELDIWYESNKSSIEKKYLLWLTVVLQRNILAIMLCHQSMGSLVQAARHTWASWHRQAGTSCDELKELGGWKSRSMVDRYAKYATEHLAVAAARIENGRGGNVISLSTFSPRQKAKRASS